MRIVYVDEPGSTMQWHLVLYQSIQYRVIRRDAKLQQLP